MRKSVIIVSVAMFGVGVWLLTRVHSVRNTCSATVSVFTGKGVVPNCENVASFYFLGFALTILGLVVLATALVAMARRDREERERRRRTISSIRRHEPPNLRDVA
jgi:hydrogenase/urease accessory protein HupE